MANAKSDKQIATLTIKNHRSKISPGGVITLSVAARKTLKMSKGAGNKVLVALDQDAVSITPSNGIGGTRVSPKGMMELQGEARALLEKGEKRHFWLELFDEKQMVLLHPFN